MRWCAFYRNVLSGDKDSRPPNKYLDNDFALDRWLEQKEHREWHEQNVKTSAKEGSQVFSSWS